MNKLLIILICAGVAGCMNAKEGVYQDYYDTGILKSVKSYKKGQLNGISREYYEVGTLKHAIEYKDDDINGIFNTYYTDGSLWINEIYKDGVLIQRIEYDEEGKVIRKEEF